MTTDSLYTFAHPLDSFPPEKWEPKWSVSFESREFPNYRSSIQNIWKVHLSPDFEELPDGWKIHISSDVENASSIFDTVSRLCVENKISFKHLRSTALVAAMSSKWVPRSASGKFMALYPRPEAVVEIADMLDGCLPSRCGPYVLSDFEWKGGSSVFLRWGAFKRRTTWTSSGRRVPLVSDELGLREDLRSVPANVEALPDSARQVVEKCAQPPRFDLDVDLQRAFQLTSAGGVYAGTSNGVSVVVKEARGGIDRHPGQQPAATRLKHEAQYLKRLQEINETPRFIDSKVIADNVYLVASHLPGMPLRSWVSTRHPLLHGESSEQDLNKYRMDCLHIADSLRNLVSRIHNKDVAHRDIHPGNILVTDDLNVGLIDFEQASALADASKPPNGCPGFMVSQMQAHARDEVAVDLISLWLLNPTWGGEIHLDSRCAAAAIDLTENLFPSKDSKSDCIYAVARKNIDLIARAKVDKNLYGRDWVENRFAKTGTEMPLDARGGQSDLASLGLASGVGGCLLHLNISEHPDLASAWSEKVSKISWNDPGLWYGWSGVAVCAHWMGDAELAELSLNQALDSVSSCTDLSLSTGLAGILVASLELGAINAALDIIPKIVDLRLQTIESRIPGIAKGGSGIARALMSARAIGDGTASELHSAATLFCNEDLRHVVPDPSGSCQLRVGKRLLPYLGTGGVGVALAMAELGMEEAHWSPLLRPATWPLVLRGGVHEGRAGLIAALLWANEMTGLDVSQAVRDQVARMQVHLVGTPEGSALAGSGGNRICGDLLVGTAGWSAVEEATQGHLRGSMQALRLLFGGRSTSQPPLEAT